MYDTARRVALVKKRVRENARRKQRRGVYGLSAACMLLFAALIQAEGVVVGQGQTAAQGIFGAMLLRKDAGGYVLVAVVTFAVAVVLVIAAYGCARGRNGGTETRKERRRVNHEKNTIPAIDTMPAF